MANSGNKQVTRVSELILPDDNFESGKCEDNPQSYILDSSRDSPILGHHFKLPDLSKSFDPDPPTLDSSLPYIPVYTHLKTFDLVPIERPKTPPLINKLRSSGSIQTKKCSKSRPAAVLNGRTEGAAGDQVEPSTNRSGWIAKYEDSEGGTFQDESA